jgi:hypothetical protein
LGQRLNSQRLGEAEARAAGVDHADGLAVEAAHRTSNEVGYCGKQLGRHGMTVGEANIDGGLGGNALATEATRSAGLDNDSSPLDGGKFAEEARERTHLAEQPLTLLLGLALPDIRLARSGVEISERIDRGLRSSRLFRIDRAGITHRTPQQQSRDSDARRNGRQREAVGTAQPFERSLHERSNRVVPSVPHKRSSMTVASAAAKVGEPLCFHLLDTFSYFHQRRIGRLELLNEIDSFKNTLVVLAMAASRPTRLANEPHGGVVVDRLTAATVMICHFTNAIELGRDIASD